MSLVHPPGGGEEFKLLYKELSDLSRQIDAASSKCHTVSDLFGSEILAMRFKFRETCESLLCGSPQFYGRVVREKLWRHAYYDVIGRARRLVKEKGWDSLSIAYITQHLFHGIGHLNVILMKLEEQSEFKEAVFPFRLNGTDNIIGDEEQYVPSQEPEKTLVEPPKWLKDLLYIICINIGDLYRYLTDIHTPVDEDEAGNYFNRAKDYYSQAFVLFPESGFAMNQIGNLSVKLNGGIDTCYYMLHSMLSTIAYEGAASNLQHHLSNCLVQFATLPGTHESKPIEMFCNSFLTQIHHFLYENVNLTNFGKGITDLMINFQERLVSYDPDLDERFLFRISSICVLTFWQLQAQNSTNISLAVAFATAMFSQLITQLGLILEQHSHLGKVEIASSPSSHTPSPSDHEEELSASKRDLLAIANQSESAEAEKVNSNSNLAIDDNKVAEITCRISTMDVNVNDEKAASGKDSNSKDSEKPKKKKKNFLAVRRRRRVYRNMIPTSSSDEEESDGDEHNTEDGSYVGSNDEKSDSADSDYCWSSDSNYNDYSDSDENADGDEDGGSAVNGKRRQVSGEKAGKREKDRDRHRAFGFGSSSSSNSRSDASGNNFKNPPVLEFDGSGKNTNSTNSNCSHGGVDIEICEVDNTLRSSSIQIGNTNESDNVTEKFIIGVDELKKCRSQLEPLLVALLPFIRWLQVSPEIKDAFAANCGKDYVMGMCNMFNLLGSQNWARKLDEVGIKVKEDWKLLESLGQKVQVEAKSSNLFQWQLPEDRSMLGLQKYDSLVKDFDATVSLNSSELIVSRMARILLFGHWLVETKSFSMIYDDGEKQFKYCTPKMASIERGHRKFGAGRGVVDTGKKIRSLMDLDPDVDALTKAYKQGGENRDGRHPRGGRDRNNGKNGRDRNRDRDRRRGRRGGGGERVTNDIDSRSFRGGDRSKDAANIVFVVVDLPAVLYNLRNLQKLANNKRFVVVLPRPVWKAIDDLKDSKDAGADEARTASIWLKACSADGHRGVRCLRDHEKMPIECDYPKVMDTQTSDFFLMMETCKYLLTNNAQEKSSRTFFGDMRDKFRVIYLSGYLDMLTPRSSKDFSPIGTARLVGTFVDLVTAYPPSNGRRKWKSGKSNG